MRAHDITSSPAATVTPDVSIPEAAELLASHGFTALPVVEADRRAVGIVTEPDLLRDEHEGGTEPLDAPVEEVMTTPALGRDAGSPVAPVARLMVDDRARCVPTVAGTVTKGDLVRAQARSDSSVAADVRQRPAVDGDTRNWSVSVRDGVVDLRADFVDPESEQVVVALAEGVPGVTEVHVLTGRDLP